MQRLRAPGVRGTSGGGLTLLGWAYIDTGRWDEALEVAAEAASMAEANQMDIVAASADVITATVLALRGDSGAARKHAGRALATVDPAECGLVVARARRALGVATLADGSYLSAFTQLRGLFSDDGTPLHNYASYLGVADLAAAAVRAERRTEGCDVIEHALSRLEGRASARLEQLIARARGILAGPEGAEAHFDKELSDPAGDQWPFERAQLRLDYAEWLRRRRRINDAKPVLAEALGTFRRLDARSWTQRAQAELRASGVAVTGASAERDALGELTPQQRQIVRLASNGLTDREIGDRLFLSPRTVSSHLYRSYPKHRSWGTAGGGPRAASRARSRARAAVHPRRDAGAALRHRPARHRLRLRPGRHRRLAAHHPARPPVQHALAAAGRRAFEVDPAQHPPRRAASPTNQLRLAPLRGPHRRRCDVHHLQHQKDGGKTAVSKCVLLCQYHHDICIHRQGWRLTLHPDGTTTAYGPDRQVLHSHSPPTARAG